MRISLNRLQVIPVKIKWFVLKQQICSYVKIQDEYCLLSHYTNIFSHRYY